MNGDGLTDQNLRVEGDYIRGADYYTLFNHGDGTFDTTPVQSGGPPLASPYDQVVGTQFVMADLNADGLSDYVELSVSALKVCLRTGRTFTNQGWSCQSLQFNDNCTMSDGYNTLEKASILNVADIDGSGVPAILYRRAAQSQVWLASGGYDLYTCTDPAITAMTVVPNTTSTYTLPSSFPPGALQSVTALGGARQTFQYKTINQTGAGAVPVAVWVATSVQTTNGIVPGVATAVNSTVNYTYNDPVYDPRDRQFVGFQITTESHSADQGAPGLVRTTDYATTACGPSSGLPCTGQIDYGWFRALRGLPVVVTDADTTGASQSVVLNVYQEEPGTYVGLDGRVVRRLGLSDRTQYQWTPGDGGTQSYRFDPFDGFVDFGSIYEDFSMQHTITARIPNRPPTREQQWSQDSLGDQKSMLDLGQRDVDRPILTEYTWALPPGDTTGWSYRMASQVIGYTQAGRRPRPLRPHGNGVEPNEGRSYTYSYTPLGQLSTEMATVNDPTPMGSATGFTAGTPPDATTSTTVCITGCAPGGIQYDAYGNAVLTPTANGRCSGVAYDPLYAQLPTTATAYLGGCGSTSPAPMVSTTVYDRGLQQVSMKTSPAQAAVPALLTTMSFEPFGRVYQVFEPSAEVAGVSDMSADETTTYVDQGSVRTVFTVTVDSIGNGAGQTQQHEEFIDGLGDTLATSTQTSLGYVVSGAHTRYSNGLHAADFVPYYGNLIAVDPGGNLMGAGASVSTIYDGAGRPHSKTDPDNYTTQYIYQFGLTTAASAVTVIDPEQGSGSHADGSQLTSYSDGHGRIVRTDKLVASSDAGSGDLITTSTYTALGERTSITQTFPGGNYSRSMTLDMLGRMVGQSEPNTGSWQYAYNDSGDLVGVQDARGCGEVVYHDALGRKVAEDYSPCTTSIPDAYTPPNLQTGDGTEVFYVYDAYSNLQNAYDRARASSYQYDARNRPTQENRQIAVPGGSEELVSRYAPHVFSLQITSYSTADRALTYTTGADVPDLMAAGQSQVSVGYDLRGTIQSISSSYGSILVSQSVDASSRPTSQQFGDVAFTSSAMTYDSNERLQTYTLGRAQPGPWVPAYAQGGPPQPSDFTTESALVNSKTSYDMVGNPTGYSNSVNASEWPAGASPTQARTMTYWDDYRLKSYSVTYAAAGGADLQASLYTPAELSSAEYPTPAPVSTNSRVALQTFGYDLRGNVLSSTDDASDLWDRSIGAVTYQPTTDRIATSAGGGSVLYDAAGNITTATTATGVTLEMGYDELGRLARAERQDPIGAYVIESYVYDARGERVVTDKTTPGTAAGGSEDQYLVNVFPSLVLKGATFSGDYQRDDSTEQVYINSGGATWARIVYDATLPQPGSPYGCGDTPNCKGHGDGGLQLSDGGLQVPDGAVLIGGGPGTSGGPGGPLHVFLLMHDPLGSTSFTIDQSTSELVEAVSYQPYGGGDSDLRPARWHSQREDVRFGGHWDNAEVGLVYMHARYYCPELGRFISPDPQTIQGVAGDLNPYAYSHGSPMRYIDPMGMGDGDPPTPPLTTPSDCTNSDCAPVRATGWDASAALQTFEDAAEAAANAKPQWQFLPELVGNPANTNVGGGLPGLGESVGAGVIGMGTLTLGGAAAYYTFGDLFASQAPADEGDEEGGSRDKSPPTLVYDGNIMPMTADNKWQAMMSGKTNFLHYNGSGSPDTIANRAAALDGIPSFGKYWWRDEYPLASSMEGGGSAWIGIMPAWEQRLEGAMIRWFYVTNEMQAGDPFYVITINLPWSQTQTTPTTK